MYLYSCGQKPSVSCDGGARRGAAAMSASACCAAGVQRPCTSGRRRSACNRGFAAYFPESNRNSRLRIGRIRVPLAGQSFSQALRSLILGEGHLPSHRIKCRLILYLYCRIYYPQLSIQILTTLIILVKLYGHVCSDVRAHSRLRQGFRRRRRCDQGVRQFCWRSAASAYKGSLSICMK